MSIIEQNNSLNEKKLLDNKIVNQKFQALKNKCFDDIEILVFQLVFEKAYKLTGRLNNFNNLKKIKIKINYLN